ncbi:MAG: hypothetical protein OXG44_11185, partial [Gammaproteobacteria bacterium]|nr:hypothetical protein [Gammaproteobacteria bacterium]
MHYEDQMALPGGSIGSEDTSSQGTRWLAPRAADDARDETLERTTVRHGPGGWYVITAAKKTQRGEHAPRAICRCGPLKEWNNAERVLITATGAPEGSVGVELSDAQSAAVDRVMFEGLKAHVLDTAGRWTRATGTAAETMALAGEQVPPVWAHQTLLEQHDTPEGRKLEELF